MLSNIFLQISQTATEIATSAETTQAELNIFELAVKGGWIMIVLAILLIVAIYIFVERFLALRKALKEDINFMENVKGCIYSGDLEGAKNLTRNSPTPIGRMVDKGLSRLGRPLNDINQAIENVGSGRKDIWVNSFEISPEISTFVNCYGRDNGSSVEI